VKLTARGFSLATVLALVAILAFLASAMVSMFLTSLNFSQASINGRTALAQAETGLQQALYQLNQDVDLKYGLNKETLHASLYPEYSIKDSFYHVSFDPGSAYARSTNNQDGSHPTGYLGRSLPTKAIHLFSTGFCRGQWRTVEALVRQPACPIALGSTGSIHSKSPLTIEGVTSPGQLNGGGSGAVWDRPGHLICNSPNGVVIEGSQIAGESTKITGFIKSVGPIRVDQPAEVWGGLRPNSAVSVIPKFEIEKFNPASIDLDGVVRIVEQTHGAQDLDVVYYCDHDLTFEGPVKLYDSFLYVKGNLTISGGISGRGSIIVEGDVTVKNGTVLDGNNSVALLANGKVTLRGASNYFQGVVYSRKAIDAQNITVVGSVLVNNPAADGGSIELDKVKLVSNNTAGQISFTTKYYKGGGQSQSNQGEANYLQIRAVDNLGGGIDTGIPLNDPERVEKLQFCLCGGNGGPKAESFAQASSPSDFLVPVSNVPGGAPQVSELNSLYEALQSAAQKLVDKKNEDPADPSEISSAQSSFDQALLAYRDGCGVFAKKYFDYADSHSDSSGTFSRRDGAPPTDGSKHFDFDLNSYLTTSDRLQVTYWQCFSTRL
jgi:type II secretory pathway pseudopilin PulG